MSDKNPCPFCGDDSEYLRFLDLCAEHANEIWRENEVKILTDVYKSMGFVQVVRCRDCREYNTELYHHISCELLGRYVEPDGFCSWAERREP